MRLILRHHKTIASAMMVFSLLWGAATTRAQSTSFTYQGRLTDGGTGANGNYDFQFLLWDSQSGGTQIGSTQGLNVIAVSNGVFSVTLDFGASAFAGANRYLEIDVRPSGAGSFIPLAPKQQLSATPYAIRTLSATSADGLSSACSACVQDSQINSVSGNKITGAIPAGAVPAGSGNYIQNTTNQQAGTSFNISGSGTVAGTLSGNVVNATTQLNLGGTRILATDNENLFAGRSAGTANTGSRNSFFGTFAGTANTSGSRNSFVGDQAGNGNTTGVDNSFFGSSAGAGNTTAFGNSFFGSSAGQSTTNGEFNTFLGDSAGQNNSTGFLNTFIGSLSGLGSSVGNNNTAIGYEANIADNLQFATAIGARASVTQSNSVVIGSISTGAGPDTNVGIGVKAPVTRLHVKGSSWFQGDTTPFNASAGLGVAVGTGTNGGNNYGFVFSYDYNANAPRDLLLNYPGGKVGIGTFNPDQTLTVNGNASKAGGGSWATFSDERLKNLKGRFTLGLKAVLQLQPLRYEYKHDNALNLRSEGEHIGFSAQAVQRIIPEAVITSEQGYLEINNDPILWTMLNAIKEQQDQIKQQQQALTALSAQVQMLRRAVRTKTSKRR